MIPRPYKRWIGCAGLILLPAIAAAQEPSYAEKNYVKHEYQIPTRDGVKPFTAFYSPKDAAQD